MARTITIPGTQRNAKICNIIGVGALAFVPFYNWIFWYRINKEMAELGRAKNTEELGTSPGKSLLAVSLGALIIVPAVMSFFSTHKRIVAAQKLAGQEPLNGWISVIAYFVFSPAWLAYMQSGLNGVWESMESTPATTPAAAITESAAHEEVVAAEVVAEEVVVEEVVVEEVVAAEVAAAEVVAEEVVAEEVVAAEVAAAEVVAEKVVAEEVAAEEVVAEEVVAEEVVAEEVVAEEVVAEEVVAEEVIADEAPADDTDEAPRT